MFDPSVGRFISEDPIGFAAEDANLYRYVLNSPTTLTDPTGLNPNQLGARDADEMIRIVEDLEEKYRLLYGEYPSWRAAMNLLMADMARDVDFGSNHYYVFCKKDQRWIDMRHFIEGARFHAWGTPKWTTKVGGYGVEAGQWIGGSASRWGAEDLYSNRLGTEFQKWGGDGGQTYDLGGKKRPRGPSDVRLSEKLRTAFHRLGVGNKSDSTCFGLLPKTEEEWDKWRNTPGYYQHMVEREGAMVMPWAIAERIRRELQISPIPSPRVSGSRPPGSSPPGGSSSGGS